MDARDAVDLLQRIAQHVCLHTSLLYGSCRPVQAAEVPPLLAQHQLLTPKKEPKAPACRRPQVSISAQAGPLRHSPIDSILAHYPGSALSAAHLPQHHQRTLQQRQSQQQGSCAGRAFTTVESIGSSRALAVIGGQLLASFSGGSSVVRGALPTNVTVHASVPAQSCAAMAALDLESTPKKPAQPTGARVALLQGLGKGFAGSPCSSSHVQDSARGGGVLRSGLRQPAATLDNHHQQQKLAASMAAMGMPGGAASCSAQERAVSSVAISSAGSVHSRSVGPKPNILLPIHSQFGAPPAG